MAKGQTNTPPKEDEQEEEKKDTKANEKATAKSKYYDVLDIKGNLINIYEDKATAEAVAAKKEGRTVMPSPAERTREHVRDAALEMKASRLKKLEQSNPGHYTP